jgi:hypothetical protein
MHMRRSISSTNPKIVSSISSSSSSREMSWTQSLPQKICGYEPVNVYILHHSSSSIYLHMRCLCSQLGIGKLIGVLVIRRHLSIILGSTLCICTKVSSYHIISYDMAMSWLVTLAELDHDHVHIIVRLSSILAAK